jgi:hypothetical protein
MARRAHPRHVDLRRALLPRDYLADPYLFGREPTGVVLPQGGDRRSQQVARLQHQLALAWVRAGRRPTTTTLCERWGFSPSVWSRIVNGTRWAGETGMCALLDAVRSNAAPRP